MAILSSDKLVVVKAFAPGNPLPLDAREIYDSLAAAQEYAASSAVAYAGQTIKVVEGNSVTAYTLAPSDEEGVNYKLQFVGGGAGSIQAIGSSTKAGHITVTGVNGEETVTSDVAVTGAYVGAEKVEETAEKSAATKFTYVNAAGAQQTKNVYESGVRKVELSEGNTSKFVVTKADKDGVLSTSEILVGVGSVKNPTYDSTNRKITLPVMKASGATEDLVIDLGKDMVVKSGSYDVNTKQIVLVLTDDSEVRINASDLVDIYTGGETTTAKVTVTGNVITATVNISAEEGNKLVAKADGLYVLSPDEELNGLQEQITALDEAYKAADDAIGTRIGAVETDVNTIKTTTIPNLDAAYKAADQGLQNQITENKNAISLINGTTIPNLDAAYKAADQALDGRVSDVETDLATLVDTTVPALDAAYKAADQALDTKIGNVSTEVNTLKDTTIPNLDAAYKAADVALGGRIDGVVAEVNTLKDTTIPALDTAYKAADTAIGQRIDALALEVSANATAIGNEASARAAAFVAEESARNTAITNAIAAEVTARNAAIAEAVKAAGVQWVDFGADEE